VDGRVIGNGQVGAMTRRLQDLYVGLLDEECPA
jgi:branched-subunit amino acid aminotransferase/4-amino-4-deoxychorismate lyase